MSRLSGFAPSSASRNPQSALRLLDLLKSGVGTGVEAFELMPRIAIDFVLRHGLAPRDPLSSPHPWYALIDLASSRAEGFEDAAIALLERAHAQGLCEDVAVAASLAQRHDFWRLREAIPEAQKREGGSIKHDVSVPLGDVPAFIAEASRAVLQLMPRARPTPFGHMGDGNIHFNVSQPIGADRAEFLARWGEVNEVVHGVVARFGGSISAEHGVGQLKRELLARTKDPTALAAMRAIKAALDPKGILNPGKLL